MQAHLNPYINFGGKSREAMAFYQSVLGGETYISTFADQGVPGDNPNGVMHAQLTVDGKIILMASDGMDKESLSGFSLSLSGKDGDELRQIFQKLSEGGEVTKPLSAESWGDEFGMLRDQFGVNWMINIVGKHEES